MATFTVRVQLHLGDGAADYSALHHEMDEEGFTRTIQGSDGLTYQLPHGEYNLVGDLKRREVAKKVRRALERSFDMGSILITESAGRFWLDLALVAS